MISLELPVLLLLLRGVAASCNSDNCLRGLKASSSLALGFYQQYTSPGYTSAIPLYASACSAIPSKISSACSCLITASPTGPTTTSRFRLVLWLLFTNFLGSDVYKQLHHPACFEHLHSVNCLDYGFFHSDLYTSRIHNYFNHD